MSAPDFSIVLIERNGRWNDFKAVLDITHDEWLRRIRAMNERLTAPIGHETEAGFRFGPEC